MTDLRTASTGRSDDMAVGADFTAGDPWKRVRADDDRAAAERAGGAEYDDGVGSAALPAPRFGLSYTVIPAARFDPPDQLLGELLTRDLPVLADLDALIDDLADPTTEAPRTWQYAAHSVGAVGERVVVVTVDRSASHEVSVAVLLTVLQRWRRHLIAVPEQLDRVSVEAAAAQCRIAAISWLESGVAIAAGHGWTVEAGQMSSIRNLIDDGARTQNTTMRGAGEKWAALRAGFVERRPGDPSVESVAAALDQLLGT